MFLVIQNIPQTWYVDECREIIGDPWSFHQAFFTSASFCSGSWGILSLLKLLSGEWWRRFLLTKAQKETYSVHSWWIQQKFFSFSQSPVKEKSTYLCCILALKKVKRWIGAYLISHSRAFQSNNPYNMYINVTLPFLTSAASEQVSDFYFFFLFIEKCLCPSGIQINFFSL